MRLEYSKQVSLQLRSIKEYISKDLNSPQAAIRITDSITNRCKILKDFPELGRTIELFDGSSARLLILGNYIVLYTTTKNAIRIVSIEDSRTNWLSALVHEL